MERMTDPVYNPVTNPADRGTPVASEADVLIVGAGICGLMAAAELASRRTDHGLRTVLLDKGRVAGGRLSTRRIGLGRADHGAQFFTARDPRFAKVVERWHSDNLVFRWSNGWSDCPA